LPLLNKDELSVRWTLSVECLPVESAMMVPTLNANIDREDFETMLRDKNETMSQIVRTTAMDKIAKEKGMDSHLLLNSD
jgi:hypothetical protein